LKVYRLFFLLLVFNALAHSMENFDDGDIDMFEDDISVEVDKVVEENQEIEPVVLEPQIVSEDEANKLLRVNEAELQSRKNSDGVIVDDLHKHPSIIKVKDYLGGKSKKGTSKPTLIIKYINPAMKKINIDEPQYKLSFWQLLNTAMQKSASIILKKHDLAINEANINILKSTYYPNISLSYLNEYYHGFSRSSPANIGGAVYPSTSNYQNSLNLNVDYEVYNFGASKLKMQMSETDRAILKSEIALEKEKIAKELLNNFLTALKAQERMKTYKKILFIKNLLLKSTQRLFKSGFASKADIARLRIDEANIEKDILMQKMKILEASKNIQLISNVKIDTLSMGFDMLKPLDGVVKDFKDSAKARNIKLKIRKKFQEIGLLKKDNYPTVHIKGAYQIYGDDLNNDFDAIGELERNNWNIGIMLKWNIFNGYKTKRSIEKAKLEIEKLATEYKKEMIAFRDRQEKRELLKDMISKIMSQEAVLLDEVALQNELLSRLQKAGNISILEVDKAQIARLKSELDFRLSVIDKIAKDVEAQLLM